MNRIGWRVGLAALGGALQALSMAWPWADMGSLVAHGHPSAALQCLALVMLVAPLQHMIDATEDGARRWRCGALMGGAFALAWMTGTVWWLFISMHRYGGLPAPLAAAAVLALCAFLALYYAAAAALYALLARACRPWRALLFAALWTLAELARGNWLTGFPWGATGYAHGDGPLAALAPWFGVYGMGAVAAWLSAALAALAAWPWRRSRVIAALAAMVTVPLAVIWAGGAEYTGRAGRLSLALLQGQIAQDQKFEHGTGVVDALRWYGEQLRLQQAALLVAPETALPLLPQQLPDGYWDALRQQFANGGRAALLGLPMGSVAEGYTNSVLGLKPGQGEPYRYSKVHLVPFGEFIPPLFRWFTDLMNIPLGDFNRGALGQASFEWQGQRLAPHVCYEDLFGEELATRFADAATAPTVLVNVSNIGWFGNTVAIDQHLQISRLRALEFERPVVRATNTGATVVIDHRGRVAHALDRTARGVLMAEVEGRKGLTPYARWCARWGLGPLWGLMLAALACAMWQYRRAQKAPGTHLCGAGAVLRKS